MGSCGSIKKIVNIEEKTASERREAWGRIRKAIPREKTAEAKERRIELFKAFDKNERGRLSREEVYMGCRVVLKLEEFTIHLRDITKRAFNKAKDMGTKVEGRGSDYFVEFLEFCFMLCYIYDYFELIVMFDEIGTSGNMRIDLRDLKNAAPKIGSWGVKMEDPEKVFKDLDTNATGAVSLDEFAAWGSAQKLNNDGDVDKV